VGSENAEAALESSDRNLALVLRALEDKGVLNRTDILVVSDHGFSTIDRGPDLIKSLKRAKFVAGAQFDNPEPGDIMVVNLGGSAFFYVFEHHPPTIRRLVEYLQSSDFAGVIFSALPIEGTFSLAQARLDAPRGAPDVAVSLRWSGERNEWGAAGMLTAAGGKRGRGSHASLSPFDIHNTLVAAGPDFKKGFVSELPSGNVDVPPTVLAILGVPSPSPMDGRILAEAMVGSEHSALKPVEQRLEATRDLGIRVWHQYLRSTRVGSVIYHEEGNGESRWK
jgi:arylsulfatase A-like enzyme